MTTNAIAAQDREPRCWRCNKKLAELVSRPWMIICWRCKARNQPADSPLDSTLLR